MRLIPLAILCLFLSLPPSISADDDAPQRKPNIVFILADDLGYGDLGCYGQDRIQTPHIDRLAKEGMKFTQFYAGSTVCAPSRCVLMTGLHTGHCYIRGNAKVNLRPEDLTIAEHLKATGYTTGLFGKWGLGTEDGTGAPNRKGFDEFFGYVDQTHAHNYYPSFLNENDKRVTQPNVVPNEGPYGQGVATRKVAYSHDLIVQKMLGFVEKHHDEPFFLYAALTIPHANNQAGKAGMEVPNLGPYAGKDWPEASKGLAAMITRMDSDIGRLMTLLKKHGIDENTIVLFSSDNGPHREGGNDPTFFDSNGPLRGIKRDLYEGGIRVPMIARWPGRITPGVETNHIGYFADLFPTFAELGGATVPDRLDGLSIVPMLTGDDAGQKTHPYLYWEFYEGRSRRAVRFGRWKAIEEPLFSGVVQLYDLETDLAETQNLAATNPGLIEKAKGMMEEAHTPDPKWQPRSKKKSKKR